MAKSSSRTIDRNRYGKKYPLIRAPKKMTFQSTANLEIEVLSIEFVNESAKEATFEVPYPDTDFRILVSPRDTTTGDSAQVTLAVDNALTDTSKARIEASAPFTGIVDVIVIRVTE
tara:strand:+ start:228 stop:575 length:348 start_codon:yes stop_codon:yes gene_type:complete